MVSCSTRLYFCDLLHHDSLRHSAVSTRVGGRKRFPNTAFLLVVLQCLRLFMDDVYQLYCVQGPRRPKRLGDLHDVDVEHCDSATRPGCIGWIGGYPVTSQTAMMDALSQSLHGHHDDHNVESCGGTCSFFFFITTATAKRKFLGYFTSFRLIQLHVFCLLYAILNHLSTPLTEFHYGDLYVAMMICFVYMLLYLLILDRIGVHIYPIFSPRIHWCVLSWSGIWFLHLVIFWMWNGILRYSLE